MEEEDPSGQSPTRQAQRKASRMRWCTRLGSGRDCSFREEEGGAKADTQDSGCENVVTMCGHKSWEHSGNNNFEKDDRQVQVQMALCSFIQQVFMEHLGSA